MDIFLNTYWMKPHTVMRSLLYEGYRKLGLKQINSADLESQFTRVIRLIVKKKKNKQKKKKNGEICGKYIDSSFYKKSLLINIKSIQNCLVCRF